MQKLIAVNIHPMGLTGKIFHLKEIGQKRKAGIIPAFLLLLHFLSVLNVAGQT